MPVIKSQSDIDWVILGDEITGAEMRQCVGTKTVQGCGEWKLLDEFSTAQKNGNIYHRNICKECTAEYRSDRFKETYVPHPKQPKETPKEKVCTGSKKIHGCNILKPIEAFTQNIGRNGKIYYNSYCIECHKIYQKKYYEENKEKAKINNKKNYEANKDERLAYSKRYMKDHPEIKKKAANKYYHTHKEDVLEYRKNNKEKIAAQQREYNKNRRKNPAERLHQSITSRVRQMLKSQEATKGGQSILDYLPYSIDELLLHIESQFEEWMTWENRGQYIPRNWDDKDPSTWKWQLDHIVPRSETPYSSMTDENFRKTWALSNIRPLSAKQNVMDGVQRIRHTNKSRSNNKGGF